MHPSLISRLTAGFALTLALALPAAVVAQSAPNAIASAPTAMSAGVAPTSPVVAEPKVDETNAQRAKSQPGNNAPFWRGVQNSGVNKGISNLPGAENGVLIQEFVQYPGARLTTAGEGWRQVRNQWIIPYGGSLIVITLLALALFYFSKGPLGGHVPNTGRMIERFTYFERAAHWSNAVAFTVLAISGIVMAFGKFWLQPVIGSTLFGWLSYALKTSHNLVGPLFAVSMVIVFITFVRDNLPARGDLHWLLKGGGMFSGTEIPSGRFNAGEKFVFWMGVFVLGVVIIASGLVLDQVVPGLAYLRGDMQIANMIHGVSAVLMMVLFLGHIYLGTIGTKDAFNGMKTGYVDEGWAREHHALWLEDIRTGKIPAQRTPSARGSERPAAQY